MLQKACSKELQTAFRNSRHPVGPESGLHLRTSKKLGPSVHCRDVNSAYKVKEFGGEFFPLEPPDENAASLIP